jgi:hypothetical protein
MADKNRDKNRDETKDVGSGRRRISRDDQGKATQKKDEASDATHPPTDKDKK